MGSRPIPEHDDMVDGDVVELGVQVHVEPNSIGDIRQRLTDEVVFTADHGRLEDAVDSV